MAMMECGHCHRVQDARAMQSCEGCNSMICSQCQRDDSECPCDESDYDPR